MKENQNKRPAHRNPEAIRSFLLLTMTVHPDQADTKWIHISMNWRECVQLPLYVYDIDANIDTQIIKTPHILLLHLAALDNGRNTGIGIIKKERGYIF